MSFADLIKNIVDNVNGCSGGMIIGIDGIAVEQYIVDGEIIDLQNIGVEYTSLVKDISDASRDLGLSDPEQLTIEYDDTIFILRSINKEYFIILSLKKSGNIGKARFLLRKNISALAQQF